MNHVMHQPLFGKQESQELIQESWNQAKIQKIPESCRSKFRVADPSDHTHALYPHAQCVCQSKRFIEEIFPIL